MSIFEIARESFIDMNHELVFLPTQIDWEAMESEFAKDYCSGTRSVCNMRHWMNNHSSSLFVSRLLTQVGRLDNMILGNEKQYAGQYLILAVDA